MACELARQRNGRWRFESVGEFNQGLRVPRGRGSLVYFVNLA
jgi:hypothetical protein